jgi:hypothetical protein
MCDMSEAACHGACSLVSHKEVRNMALHVSLAFHQTDGVMKGEQVRYLVLSCSRHWHGFMYEA